MMRKVLPVIALITLVAIVFSSFACAAPAPTTAPTKPPTATTAPAPGASSPTAAPPAPTAVKLPSQFVFGASGAGKAFALSAFLSEMATKYTTMKGATEKVTSSPEALSGVGDGTYQSAVYSAASALGVTDPVKKKALRVLFCGAGPETSTVIGIQTATKSNIKTVKDLKGKRVYAENPALYYFGPIMDIILKTNGMTRTDFKWLQFNDGAAAYNDLKNGVVDALFYVTGTASADFGQGGNMYVVPLSPETQKAIEASGVGFVGDNWPKGMFGNEIDTPTVSSPNLVWSSTKLSDDAAYTYVKAIWSNLKELQGSQKAAEGFNNNTALIQWSVPYHPGAIKYFKEIGVWKAEFDQKQADALAKWNAQ
jgi:TRAP transporter TAXI family solute receptor